MMKDHIKRKKPRGSQQGTVYEVCCECDGVIGPPVLYQVDASTLQGMIAEERRKAIKNGLEKALKKARDDAQAAKDVADYQSELESEYNIVSEEPEADDDTYP